jgi:hypothetical protein
MRSFAIGDVLLMERRRESGLNRNRAVIKVVTSRCKHAQDVG